MGIFIQDLDTIMDRNKFIKSGFGLAAAASIGMIEFDQKEYISKLPKKLNRGDKIAITAPAGAVWADKHFAKIEAVFKPYNFEIIWGETTRLKDGYLAGTDRQRADEMLRFFKDSSIKAIFTMRGGYGSNRILDLLDFDIIAKNPKILMGFSDITYLLNAIYKNCGIVTYHGPCIYSSWGKYSMNYFDKVLMNGSKTSFENFESDNNQLKTIVGGEATGKLVGGNLTVLSSMIGTEFEPNWQNKILFIEDIGEEPYRIDRLLQQMLQANVFDKINGLIIGAFEKCEAEFPLESFTIDEVFDQYFNDAKYPIFKGANFGHIVNKYTLPIGINVKMNANNFEFVTLERSVE